MKKSTDLNPDDSNRITPAFPRWERSFVSGPSSPLFQVEHSISRQDPLVLFTRVKFLPQAEGPPGHVHGGATAGLLDEVMGILVWHHGHASLTQSIQIEFKKAIPIAEPCLIVTRIDSIGDQKVDVSTTVFDSNHKPHVLGKGLFHRLSKEQLERFK
ncbi:MAG: PaaI family thioesterase [Bdellovibrionales bacterium]|nr:PaaI family thioesterase [Bdellovibrionales bacterium]